jgi:hypothetical protein
VRHSHFVHELLFLLELCLFFLESSCLLLLSDFFGFCNGGIKTYPLLIYLLFATVYIYIAKAITYELLELIKNCGPLIPEINFSLWWPILRINEGMKDRHLASGLDLYEGIKGPFPNFPVNECFSKIFAILVEVN